jgi:methionyl-tRNA formyltransferase
MGVVNVHPSLLPMYRGPSPVATAILDGQRQTGVTVMLLDEGMDTGPVLAQSPPIVLAGNERAGELQGRLFEEGAAMLPAVLDGLEDVTIVATPQDDSKATVTRLLARSDGEIDWSLPAEQIDRMIRAYDPWPGTFTSWNDKGLKILDVNLSGRIDAVDDSGRVIVNGGKLFVGTGSGPLEITRLQLEGRQGVSASDFLRGRPDIDDAVLGVLS